MTPESSADAHARRQHLAYTIHESEAELDAWIMREAGRIGGSEVARLRAALKPFAEFGTDRDRWAWEGKHDNAIVCGSQVLGHVTRAAFRLAARALEPTHAD